MSKRSPLASVGDPFLDPPSRDVVDKNNIQTTSTIRLKFRAPLASRSDNTVQSMETLDLTAAGPQVPLAKPFQRPRSSSAIPEPIPLLQNTAPPPVSSVSAMPPALARLKKTLRVRDSLPGTFALEVLDLSGPNTDYGPSSETKQPEVSAAANIFVDNGADSGLKKRKASPSKAVNVPRGREAQKRWRVSQVEVLDLTSA